MAGALSEVDAQTLQDLRAVEQACQVFGAGGTRAEFWEAFTLLKTGREACQAEVERLADLRRKGVQPSVDPGIVLKLGSIRSDLGPLARLLREFLGKVPDLQDSLKQDLALVFLMGSASARASVARWVRSAAETQAEWTLRLKILSRLVNAYRAALLEGRRVETGGAPAETPTHTPGTSIRLKPDFLEDLRRVERCRSLMPEAHLGASWEILCLILMKRDDTRSTIELLGHLKTFGRPGEFPGVAARLRGDLAAVRAEHGPMMAALQGYMKVLYGTWSGPVEDLALSFLVASQQGRHRARQWLDDPELCRGEAIASMNGLRTRARGYLDALAQFPAVGDSQPAGAG